VKGRAKHLSVLYIARVGLERTISLLPQPWVRKLSVLYIARVGLEREPSGKLEDLHVTLSVLYIARVGLELPSTVATRRAMELSVLYIARVGLEHVYIKDSGRSPSPFSPLHSEGGIGTPQRPHHGRRLAGLSVLYIARVGLELPREYAYKIGREYLSVLYIARVGLERGTRLS